VAKKSGSWGLVMLVVVMAVVLLLVAQSWKKVAPQAIDVSRPASVASDHGDAAAGAAVRSGELPGLEELRQGTDAHAADVQQALAGTE